jgi:hypothetical protein
MAEDIKPVLNRKQTDFELKDALNFLKKDIMLNLSAQHIGIVKQINFENQTLSAQIAYKKSFLQKQADDTYKTILVDYPPLIDVPFVVYGGGKASLQMPIAAGDECLLLFNDRDIDNWWASGQVAELSSNRLHSFSDAIAIVGVRSLARSISNYDSETAALVNDEGFVRIKDNKIGIGNASGDLRTVLDQLITALVGLTTTNTVPGAPASLSPASITALNNITTLLAGILE